MFSSLEVPSCNGFNSAISCIKGHDPSLLAKVLGWIFLLSMFPVRIEGAHHRIPKCLRRAATHECFSFSGCVTEAWLGLSSATFSGSGEAGIVHLSEQIRTGSHSDTCPDSTAIALESNPSSQEFTLLLLLPRSSSPERVSGFRRAWGWPSPGSLLLHSTPGPVFISYHF